MSRGRPRAAAGLVHEFHATRAESGWRLDQALASWLGEPRTRAAQRIADGDVAVDGAAAPKSHRLTRGEGVRVAIPAGTAADAEQAADASTLPEVPVRYRDAHLLVAAKPAGLVVHEGAGVRGPTLVDVLVAMGEELAPGSDPTRPGIVHRLDRGTSGLLAIARTGAAHAGLRRLFDRHVVEREYAALVDGVPHERHATVDAPIGRHPTHRTRFAVDATGRAAVTHYDVAEDLGPAALLRVRLETGRTHQVRVHLAAIGHPILGDDAYGASPLGARLGLTRPALHAGRLAFRHPVTGEAVDVREPVPADMDAALTRLREGRA